MLISAIRQTKMCNSKWIIIFSMFTILKVVECEILQVSNTRYCNIVAITAEFAIFLNFVLITKKQFLKT